MARKRLSMRKIRDVLRLKYSLGRSNREIGAILRISHSTVGSYVRRAREAGVSWPLPDDLDDARLEAALYPPTAPSRVRRPEPDWARVHRELGRHKCMTLQLLWFEYREAHPDGYQYSRFCDRYREWRGRVDVVLRQVYRAGEKAFVDYAGPTVEVTDRRTGEIHEAKVFVGVLACALGHQACRNGISTRYFRVSRLLDDLALALADGSYQKLVQRLAKTRLLVLNDWGLASLSGQSRHDLLKVLDDRYARRGTPSASSSSSWAWFPPTRSSRCPSGTS